MFLRYADFRDATIKEQCKSERWIVRRILTTKEVRVLKSFTPRETYHWNSAADFERRLTAAANIKVFTPAFAFINGAAQTLESRSLS